ncbi:MAG: transglycosylase domain-containing protein [Candidatus Excrementavichristensenella sp.]|jgi:penicillin-binding protein 1A
MSLFKARTRDRSFLFSVILTTAKMLFVTLLILAVAGTGVLMGIAKAWVETAPQLDMSVFGSQAKTSFVYDKYGELITDFKGNENRIDATWNEIPDNLKKAVIAIEDQRFHTHNGVDIRRYISAFIGNLFSNDMQGGSTITCQLVKLTMLSSEQTFKRKLQEAYLALELEKVMSKNDILLQYMNLFYQGGSNYGVKVAARDYFGKELRDLSLRECAALARIIRNPYRYNPRRNYYGSGSPEIIEDGADYVLRQMHSQGLITDRELSDALSQRLFVLEHSVFTSKLYDHAYYVEYAISDVVTKMLRKEGLQDTSANRSQMEHKLRTGGYKIYTCLDPVMQQAVQNVVTEWKDYPATRSASDKFYMAPLDGNEKLKVLNPQAAVVVMDQHTGELVAVVGGRSEPIQYKQLNRASYGNMPIGSSIKPLSVYGPALDLGNSPGSPVINAPLKIDGWNTPKGYPANFGESGYNGVESLRYAMAKSHNTASAQALFTYVGIENSMNYLLKLGVSADHIEATGAGLSLGASGLSMVELAGGFAAIANKGLYLEPCAFTKVIAPDGSVYLDAREQQVARQVFKESTAWMLTDMLEDCVGPHGTGSNANFGNFTVAGKTGTNSDYRGVSFAGMTGYYTGAVWIGCDNYKPLASNTTGGAYAAPLWSAVMSKVHDVAGITRDRPIIRGSARDYGLVKAEACAVSGMKPTRACREDVNDYGVTRDFYLQGTQPTASCTMHRTIRLCSKSRKLPTDACRSVRSYGTIYLPEGHPLRYAEYESVSEYFKGASTDRAAATIGYCTSCKGSAATKPINTEALTEATATGERLIEQANILLDSNTLTTKQYNKLKKLRDRTQKAINNGNLSNIKKYGKQLQQYIKKVR